jgi:4-hydroxyphenylacetate 3-monooxygenase
VSTLCAYSDDILVMPSTFLATNADAAPYAFGFSIPVASAGLRFICRPSVVHQNAASVMDYPLSSRLDEGDGLAVFDNVLVPWERVFIHRDPEMCNGLFQRTQAMPQVMHQTSVKNLAKAEFMFALGAAIARSTNIDQHLHVQGMLAELIQHAEFVRSCLRASEADAAISAASGLMTPAEMPLWTVRMMFPKMFVRACEIIQLMGAGGLVAVPSYAELSGPAQADVETYAQAANTDAAARIKLFRLAFDAAVSSFSGRQQLYERYYSGDPVRLAGALYALYEKDAPIARIHGLLDELAAGAASVGQAVPRRAPRRSRERLAEGA